MFVVYSVKGTVTVVENKVETKAKVGTILNANSSIKVAAGSFAIYFAMKQKCFHWARLAIILRQTLRILAKQIIVLLAPIT